MFIWWSIRKMPGLFALFLFSGFKRMEIRKDERQVNWKINPLCNVSRIAFFVNHALVQIPLLTGNSNLSTLREGNERGARKTPFLWAKLRYGRVLHRNETPSDVFYGTLKYTLLRTWIITNQQQRNTKNSLKIYVYVPLI